MEVSTDDGATWTKAKLAARSENTYLAKILTPAGATFVSLRATATDTKGNQVEQTIIRAYGLAG